MSGIPDEANFCPICGKQFQQGWFELVHHIEQDEFIYLTNYTDVCFDVSIKRKYYDRLFPQKTIQIPKILYETIIAQSGGGMRAIKKIDEEIPCRLMIVFGKDRFAIIIDNKQS